MTPTCWRVGSRRVAGKRRAHGVDPERLLVRTRAEEAGAARPAGRLVDGFLGRVA